MPIEIRRDAFDEPKPAGKPIYSSVPLANGDAAVVALSAVREDPSGDAKAQEAQLRREFARQAASAEAQSYAAAARADAKVTLEPAGDRLGRSDGSQRVCCTSSRTGICPPSTRAATGSSPG